MGKLIGRLLISMLMVLLVLCGTTAISVPGYFIHHEKWNACHDDKDSVDIGDKIGNGSGEQNLMIEYSGLCIRDEIHAIIPLNPKNNFSVPDDLTQYRLMEYERNIPKEVSQRTQ